LNLKRLKFIDKLFLTALLLICILGLVILSSAGSSINSDPYFYMKKQLSWMIIGIGLAVAFLIYDYTQIEKIAAYLYLLALFILIWVLAFGVEVRGINGWIRLGPLPMIQPAEFTKILLILSFANFVSRRKGRMNTFTEMLPCFAYMGLPFILVALQPDLGTALVYVSITLVMMFIGGANPKVLLKTIIAGVFFVALLLIAHFYFGMPLPLDDYQIKRLTVFVDPYNDGQGGRGAGWNTIQSLIAIGSGGFAGKGLFNGTQVQLNFLPEHHTDFIYAVIGEELGFIGSVLIIALYGILLIRTVMISFNAKEQFGSLIAVGISAMWLFHIFENIGMCIGLMPITGIPLPFLSYGGSALLTNFIGVGLLLSINVRGKKLVF